MPNEALFLRRFLGARRRTIDYYIIEAFDQPWKAHIDNAVG